MKQVGMTEAEARAIIRRENLAVSWFGCRSPQPGGMAIQCSAAGKIRFTPPPSALPLGRGLGV